MWVLSGGLFITFCMVLARIYDSGVAFQLVSNNGIYTPVYANFALGLRELSRLMFKSTTVQIPALMAWSIVAGLLISHIFGMSLMAGFMYGLRGGCVMFAGRFIVTVSNFSSGTSPTAKHQIRRLIFALGTSVLFALFLGLASVGLCLPKQSAGWLLTALAVVDGWVFFLVYAWFYEMSFFNLMKFAKR